MRSFYVSMKLVFGYRNKKLSYQKEVGAKGEHLAVKFLRKNGFKILQRNYACRCGEIDIICYDRGAIVFVEVKTRHSDTYGPPELSVTEAKKRQIIKVAKYYVAKKKVHDIDLRFDVVSILYPPHGENPTITLFKNAFTKYYDY
ncbi:MAG: YraN family protein [Candidatus Loosdrechtia sp.]|uniref:YraN family protein n=1 Tax=Candidatus Loosdrechtia sp. TaxID=3101272 RepID=UPI003A619359|nr:MAG: YraN family protein [Candidatus Jettenia sp. AMX2]